MNRPIVSVILPVYNVEKYLEQCLDSIINQSLKEIEIICVDDGSTDSSLEILKRYEKADARIKVISQKNGGAGAARNTGMEVAEGEYYSFLDSDDFFEPDMLEAAWHEITLRNADFVVFRSDQYYEETDEFKQVNWTLREKEIPPYFPITHRNLTGNIFKTFVGWAWDKLYKAEFVKKHHLRFQEQRTSNDMLFVFSALVLAERMAIVDKVLAHQRRNTPTSLSNTREKSWDCFYHALCALKDNLISYGLFWEVEQDYINYALHFSLWHLDTITGSKKEVLFNKLKQEWFREFGIEGREKTYFYNKKEYNKYCAIMENSFEDYK